MKCYKGCGTLGCDFAFTFDIPHDLRESGDVRRDVETWCREHLMSPWVIVQEFSSHGRVYLTTDHEVNLVHFKLAWI